MVLTFVQLYHITLLANTRKPKGKLIVGNRDALPKVTIYQPRAHASRHRFRNSKGQRNEISTITADVSGFYDVFLGAGWKPSLVEIDDKIKAAFKGSPYFKRNG